MSPLTRYRMGVTVIDGVADGEYLYQLTPTFLAEPDPEYPYPWLGLLVALFTLGLVLGWMT